MFAAFSKMPFYCTHKSIFMLAHLFRDCEYHSEQFVKTSFLLLIFILLIKLYI